jgi:esterase/lipase
MAQPDGADNSRNQGARGGRGGSRGGGRGGRGGRGGGRDGGRGGSRRPPEGGERRSSAPAAAAPAAPEKRERRVSAAAVNLSLSSWDLARTRTRLPDTPRGQVMSLRAHKRLTETFEQERSIQEADCSFLRVREDASSSVLLVPGVSTRAGDLHMLAGVLHEAGHTVYVMRLPDYGRPDHTIGEVSWEAALQQVRQRFRLLARGGGKVHVVGLGFGATLALHLADTENVSSLVLLSPAIMPRESFFQRLLVRLKLHRAPVLRNWIGWNTNLMEGMDGARGHLGNLKIPVYGAQCEDDDRASPESVRILQRKSRHKASRFRVFPEGGHAILTVHGETALYDDIVKFCGER